MNVTMRSRVRERCTHGSVRGLRREPLVYSTADEFLELSLFFKDFLASYSELLCIFPCFCPYGLFTRADFNDITIKKCKIGCFLAIICI